MASSEAEKGQRIDFEAPVRRTRGLTFLSVSE